MIYTHHTKHKNFQFGGKANALIEAKNNRFTVPEFLIIPADYLASLIPENVVSVTDFIRNFCFDDAFLEEIWAFFDEDSFFAVRSSALNEDGQTQSFAGQYHTELYVAQSSLNQALVAVWLSAFGDRVAMYQSKKKNEQPNFGQMAIIVQRMINADVSGVAFAVNPLNNNPNQMVINAAFGLGEGIVSGDLEADLYLIENQKIKTEIARKTHAIRVNTQAKNGTYKEVLSPEKSSQACLTELQILELFDLLKKASNHLQSPQDIEFAYQNHQLYLLQSRPITTTKTAQKSPIIWDNSNIIESYPGLTLPLTFSFIEKMYQAVYRQLSLIMGIKAQTVEENSPVYAQMLGLLCGKVYYHLNHWHKTLSLLPGYTINKGFMDNMMGVKEKFDVEIQQKSNRWTEYLNVLSALRKIIKQHNRLNQDRIAFQTYFDEVMQAYQAMNFDSMSLNELLEHYQVFEDTLVSKWKAPLVNDFFCMIYFGLLQKLVKKYDLDESQTLHNDLVSGAKDIISTEPITLTLAIVDEILSSEEAIQLFKNHSPEEVWASLQKGNLPKIHQSIQNYIQKWGDRCVGELKLESITYKQKPENYVKILQNQLQNKVLRQPHQDIRQMAEEKVNAKLKGKFWQKHIFAYVLKKARYLVSNRENLRFERTRGFGMVRQMMLAIGLKLSKNHELDEVRDIFYLKQQEVFDHIQKSKFDLKTIVELRKKEYLEFEKINLPERIKADERCHDFSVFKSNFENQAPLESLQGIACCAGVVRARVSVIHSPQEIDSLNNTILVTASTDPGWVVLFPSAAAIVVERGSLLSHSAIVSREMAIPCIVGVKNLLNQLKTGDLIEMDGSTGQIKILERI